MSVYLRHELSYGGGDGGGGKVAIGKPETR